MCVCVCVKASSLEEEEEKKEKEILPKIERCIVCTCGYIAKFKMCCSVLSSTGAVTSFHWVRQLHVCEYCSKGQQAQHCS